MNNLNELNSVLFDTLRELKAGNMQPDKAISITKVGATIINNAKIQLNAAKAMNSGRLHTEFFGELEAIDTQPKLSSSSLYDRKLSFARSMDYKGIAEAISDLGKNEFENRFKELNK